MSCSFLSARKCVLATLVFVCCSRLKKCRLQINITIKTSAIREDPEKVSSYFITIIKKGLYSSETGIMSAYYRCLLLTLVDDFSIQP